MHIDVHIHIYASEHAYTHMPSARPDLHLSAGSRQLATTTFFFSLPIMQRIDMYVDMCTRMTVDMWAGMCTDMSMRANMDFYTEISMVMRITMCFDL